MRISRPCYDKYHRCPGWNGGGTRSAKVDRCEGGYIPWPEKPLWIWWYFNRCPKCGVIVLPYMIRWLDWRYVWNWKIRLDLPRKLSDKYDSVRERTLCQRGIHCRKSREVVKFDGGRMSHLCRHCYLILWRER